MKRALPFLLLLWACASTPPSAQPLRSPFVLNAREMIAALRASSVSDVEAKAASTSLTLDQNDHCRLLFPFGILLDEYLNNDDDVHRNLVLCDIYPNSSDSSNSELDYGPYRPGNIVYKQYAQKFFLHEIVTYKPAALDTIVWTRPDKSFMTYDPNFLILKLFYHDKDFELLFPSMKNIMPFNYDTLISIYMEAYEEVNELAASLGMRLIRKKIFSDTTRYVEFAPMAFKDDLEICTWINWDTREQLQLALMPARPWNEYFIYLGYGEGHFLHYDDRLERYDTTVPSESIRRSSSFREQVEGWNIQRSDLAIWLIYSGPTYPLGK